MRGMGERKDEKGANDLSSWVRNNKERGKEEERRSYTRKGDKGKERKQEGWRVERGENPV